MARGIVLPFLLVAAGLGPVTLEGADLKQTLCLRDASWISDCEEPEWVWTETQPAAHPQRQPHLQIEHLNISGYGCGDAFVVLSAPSEMWRQVPEDLLPRWPGQRSRQTTVPIDSEAQWRLRVIGEHSSSDWVDVDSLVGVEVMCAPGTIDVSAPAELAQVRILGGRTEGTIAVLRPIDGRVRTRVPPRNLIWLFEGPSMVPIGLTGSASELPLRFVPRPGRVVRAAAIDMSGAPVVDGTASIEAISDGDVAITVQRDQTVDGDGVVEFGAVPTTLAALRVTAPGKAPVLEEIPAGTEDVDLGALVLVPGVEVAVTIADLDGAPVPRAEVRSNQGHEVVTDASGIAQLGEASATSPLALTVEARGFLDYHGTFEPPFEQNLTVALSPAAKVLGRIIQHETGLSPSNGSVVIESNGDRVTAVANRDGSFEVPVPSGRELRVTVQAASSGSIERDLSPIQPGDSLDLGDVVLPPGLGAIGRLLAADGTPVAAAKVWALRTGEMPLFSWYQDSAITAFSDDEGRFELWGLEAGEALLRIKAPGFAPKILHANPDPAAQFEDLGAIFLDSGATVDVITDSSEGHVDLDPFGFGFEFDFLDAEVSAGVATLHHVPLGRIVVHAFNADGHLTCERSWVVDQSSAQLDCNEGGVEIEGVALVGNRPVPLGEVLWSRPPQGPSLIHNAQSSFGARRQQVYGGPSTARPAMVDGGRFAAHLPSPGEWQATLESAGARRGPITVAVADQDKQNVTLRFGGLVIEGLVLDPEGSPVRALVEVGETATTTQPNGEFRIEGLAAGSHRLRARALNDPNLTAERGLLLEDHRNSEFLRLELSRAETDLWVRATPGATVFLEVEQGAALYTATAGPRGIAEFRLNGAGGVVRATSWNRGAWSIGTWQPVALATERGLEIEQPSTGTLVIRDFDVPEITLSRGDWVYGQFASRLGLPSRLLAGQLTVSGLPSGTWSVTAGSTLLSQVYLRPNDTTIVEPE